MTADTDQPTLAVTLKPCPFCGGERARTIHIRDGRKVACICGACGKPEFHGPLDRPDAETRAITAWNTRTNSEPRPAGDLREALEAIMARQGWGEPTLADGGRVHGDLVVSILCSIGELRRARAALATHSPAPMAGEGWQDIESAPRDGTPFIATLTVRNLSGQKWWETHVIWTDDETGEVASECEAGWSKVDDYSHWMPLPTPPAAAHPSTQEGADRG